MNQEEKEKSAPEDIPGIRETRPWGGFEVLREESKFKVKRIEINPGQRLSRLHVWYRDPHDLAPTAGKLVDLTRRRRNVTGVALGHRLDDHGPSSPNLNTPNVDCPGRTPVHHGTRLSPVITRTMS